ncbi:MAG: M24 family metallopeptidase, partial [Rhodospirillaceae bacterium]
MKPRVRDLVNIGRLEAKMDAYKMDAVVARAGINLCYLAGFAYPGTLARHVDLADSPRPIYLIWPRHGEPRMVLNLIAAGLTRRDSWIEKFDTYEAYIDSPAETLAKSLADMGLADARVGFEKNYISAADWEVIARNSPRMTMLDSATMMDEVRVVKTEGEIALFKKGADILDDAFMKCFPMVRPGMRERDLHGALMNECLVGGCEFVHGILNSSRNTIAYAGESDFAFAAGDAIRTDYVAYHKGYPGHQSRCAVVGKASAAQKAEYRVIRDLYRASCAQLHPGRTAGEVCAFVTESFGKAGLPYKPILAGHGVGAWWHQQEPIISRGNPRVLEEGMVIAMEPHVNHWHIQDIIVVRKDGAEVISDKMSTD